VFDWLKQFNRKGRKFGLVILDPPSFSRSGKSGSFSVINDYASLVELAANLVEPSGWILACSNHRKLTNNKFISSIKEGVKNAKRKIIDIELSQMPFDFSGEKYLKSVWVKLS
jgi:23S rRNA (cytosine1962-C5)-methyltransferase